MLISICLILAIVPIACVAALRPNWFYNHLFHKFIIREYPRVKVYRKVYRVKD